MAADPIAVNAQREPGSAVSDHDVEADHHDVLTRGDLTQAPGGRSRLPVALLVVAALIAGFVLGRATGGEDATSTDQATGGTTEDGSLPFPSGDQNRTGFWGFANLEPMVIDTFDRSDDPSDLGSAGTGQDWETVAGTWGIDDDSAVTSGGEGPRPSLAVVPEGTGDGLTEVTMTVVEEGAGLVFRYLDPENYWSVTANPGVGSWSVNRVIDGETEAVGEAPGPTEDGITVSVTQDGSTVRILLEGDEYLSFTDGALSEQLQGGIIASAGTTGDARWDRFLVMRFRDAEPAASTTAP